MLEQKKFAEDLKKQKKKLESNLLHQYILLYQIIK